MMPTRTPKTQGQRSQARQPKKRYNPPVVTRYGTITEITRASANSGMLDGGSFSLRTGGTV